MARTNRISRIERFSVYWVELDPTKGYEIKKTRPCVVISPNNINDILGTVIVAPITSQMHHFPYRLPIVFKNTKGEIALDQMRCVDKSRLRKLMGRLDADKSETLMLVLGEMFAW